MTYSPLPGFLFLLLTQCLIDFLLGFLVQQDTDPADRGVNHNSRDHDRQHIPKGGHISAQKGGGHGDGGTAGEVNGDQKDLGQVDFLIQQDAGEDSVQGRCDHPYGTFPYGFIVAAEGDHAQQGDRKAEAHAGDGVAYQSFQHNKFLLDAVFEFLEILSGDGQGFPSVLQLDPVVSAELCLNGFDAVHIDNDAFIDLGK